MFRGTEQYLASEGLQHAVNCALVLERPLLVKGEPGTGKTLLAEAIARSLGAPLIAWNVKSTSRAQDGLYVYDTVQRLYDSRFGDGDIRDIKRYIRLGPLGQSFASKQRVVLLIDEVDKADIEFPNDLLHELDRMRFKILETDEEIAAAQRPVVVITSNNEKELPDAFLRRCVFHFIEFPDADLMRRIVSVHHPKLDSGLADQALRISALHQRADRLDRRAQGVRGEGPPAGRVPPLPGRPAQAGAGHAGAPGAPGRHPAEPRVSRGSRASRTSRTSRP
jgi:MoxR-like ATPase